VGKCEIIQKRYTIIQKLFQMVLRVEKSVRKCASSCIRELVQKEQNARDLLYDDDNDKLKKILKPVLTCIQHEFSSFSPCFIQIFKVILKLMSTCFHKALPERLLVHLSNITPQYLGQLKD